MQHLNVIDVPVWEKYMLSVKEAAAYFNIGEHKLRSIVSMNRDSDFVLWNGSYPKIKRMAFEKYLDGLTDI